MRAGRGGLGVPRAFIESGGYPLPLPYGYNARAGVTREGLQVLDG
jgi:hypothetical protein